MSRLALLAALLITRHSSLPPPLFAASKAKPAKERIMEWSGGFCAVETPGHRVAKTASEWRALWKEIGEPAPAADLTYHVAVAVFLGQKPTGGYGVSFLEPARAKGALRVRYRETAPDGFVIQALTQPYAVKLFKAGGAITVEAVP